jgi:hypothetical protein
MSWYKWNGEGFGLNKGGDGVVMIGKSMVNVLPPIEDFFHPWKNEKW